MVIESMARNIKNPEGIKDDFVFGIFSSELYLPNIILLLLILHKPEVNSKAFRPALSIKLAAIATDINLTAPTNAASYFGS